MHIRCALLNLDNNKAYQKKKINKFFYLETLQDLLLLARDDVHEAGDELQVGGGRHVGVATELRVELLAQAGR